MTVYADVVMILNFVVDLLLLVATQRFSGDPIRWRRSVGGACVGGVYAGVCLLPGMEFMSNGLWRFISLCMICWITFGFGRHALRSGAMFLLLSMAMGGIAVGIGGGGVGAVVASAAAVTVMCAVGVQRNPGSTLYLPVELVHEGKLIRFTALKDTGNRLTDPLTGKPVLVVGAEIAGQLTGLTPEQLRHPSETLLNVTRPGLRLIPYQSVGASNGILLGMRIPQVKIGDNRGSVLVAFSPDCLSRDGMFQALSGGGVL